MEKNKIIIIGLVIVVIALIAGLATTLTNNGNDSIMESAASEGMEIYNFDSAFTMEVPKNTKFLKTWFDGNESFLSEGIFKEYYSKNNEFSVSYINSRMLNDERINYIFFEDLGNVTSEQSGDYLLIHYHDSTGKIGKTLDDTDFKEAIVLHKGAEIVELEGNDINFLKSMADTIKFKE